MQPMPLSGGNILVWPECGNVSKAWGAYLRFKSMVGEGTVVNANISLHMLKCTHMHKACIMILKARAVIAHITSIIQEEGEGC